MISSAAVTAVPARDHIGAAAEGSTPNSSKPRPVLMTPGGASKTAHSPKRGTDPNAHRTGLSGEEVADVAGRRTEEGPRRRRPAGREEVTAAAVERLELAARIRTALTDFFADAHTHAHYPPALLNALRAPDSRTVDLTIHGVPVALTSLASPMTLPEAHDTGQLIYSLDLAAGSHIVVTGPAQVGVFPSRLHTPDNEATAEVAS